MVCAVVDVRVASPNRLAVLGVILAFADRVRGLSGNLAFAAYADPVDAEAVRIMHEWVDEASLAAYLGSEVFMGMQAELRPQMIAPPVSRRFSLIAGTQNGR